MPTFEQFRDILTRLDIVPRFGLFISGVEVTQAVQYFQADQHLTNANDRGADNSLRLVSEKPAWVRVYPGSFGGTTGITGTLEVQRRSNGFLWTTIVTLNPQSPAVVSAPAIVDYATQRGTISSSLNFIIPANEMIGTMRLIARISNGRLTAEQTTTIAVTLRQTLRLAGVMINYNGPSSSAPNAPNVTIAAPTLAQLQAMTGTALTLFPVRSTANFRSGGAITWTRHLQDPFGTTGCTTNWDALHTAVVNARTADGNQAGWIYYGLLPAGVPMGPVGGCGGGGVSVGPVNQPGTLAHEAAHSCGLTHAPCGGAPRPDASYPAYEPYDPANTPQGSTGEYGLDVNNGNIASPQTFRDFMSYCNPSWISPYHHGRLINNALLNPTTVGIDHPWWKDLVLQERFKFPRIPEPDPPPFDLDLPVFRPPREAENIISLIVRVRRGVVAEVTHVARTRARPEVDGAVNTSLTAVLRGRDGAAIAEAPLLRLTTEACGCGSSQHNEPEPDTYLAQAFIPDVAPGAALEITDGKTALWERRAPDKAVAVNELKVKLDRSGRIALNWRAAGAPVECWVRWSTDGKNWRSLATGLQGPSAEVDVRGLPPGRVLLQAVAHDGFFSSYSKSVEVRVPARGPELAILHPVDAFTYEVGQPLRLWASGVNADGSPVDPDRCVWVLDGKEIARGLDVWVTAPKSGRHKLVVQSADKKGAGEVGLAFVTVARPETPRE